MTSTTTAPPNAPSGRIEWVDYAKGLCIVMVVAMHSTLGIEARLDPAGANGTGTAYTGFMGWIVAFAAPFRMPDFFLVAGLFLSRTIGRDWRVYADRKVLHFAYFYLLWLAIQFAFKGVPVALSEGPVAAVTMFLTALVEPFGTLWFIYMLPIFFVVTKLAREWGLPHAFMLGLGAALQIAPIHTGALLVDEFASRFVYFYAGYALAPYIFRLADWFVRNRLMGLVVLTVWAVVNGVLVAMGLAGLPFIALALGAAGAVAVVAFGVLLSGAPIMDWLRWLGSHSIVVYLAFFLPMIVTREVLMRLPDMIGFAPADPAIWAFLTTVAAVAGPCILYGLVRWTGWGAFLFERPAWARLSDDPKVPARAALN